MVRVDALARLLEVPGPVPSELQPLASHLAAFGAFLRRGALAPEELAGLAEPAGDLCLAWQVSTEALAHFDGVN
jgi:hypothetical protein